MTDRVDIFRPYIDLERGGAGPIHAFGPLMMFDQLMRGESSLGLQRIQTEAFREELRLVCGEQTQVAVRDPREVSKDSRSPSWDVLCELTRKFESETLHIQVLIARLWLSLGLFDSIASQRDVVKWQDNAGSVDAASMRWIFAFLRFMRREDAELYDPVEFRDLFKTTPVESQARFSSGLMLMAYHGRIDVDLSVVAEVRERLVVEIDRRHALSEFEALIRQSCFWRSASFVPFLKGQRDEVVAEMNRAEAFARQALAKAQTEFERIIAIENMNPLLESRSREAAWLGDIDLAIAQMRRAIEFDPYDAKLKIELGELLFSTKCYEAAAEQFDAASEVAPPAVAMSRFMAGTSYEAFGNNEAAITRFREAIRLDPDGIDSALALLRVARKLGLPGDEKLARKILEDQQAQSSPLPLTAGR